MILTIYYKDGRIEQLSALAFGYGKLRRKNSRNYYTWVTKHDEKFHKALASTIKNYSIENDEED